MIKCFAGFIRKKQWNIQAKAYEFLKNNQMIGDVKMKMGKTIRAISPKVIAVLVSISMIAGMPFQVMVTKASAATGITTAPSAGTVIPATSTGLQQSAQSASNTTSLGLSGSQPTRLDASGNPIDKNNDTPLGAKAVNFYQTLQLAVAGVSVYQSSSNTNDLYDIYNNPVDKNNQLSMSNPLLKEDTLKDSNGDPDWRTAPKDMTSADIYGTGKDVVAVAALPLSKDRTSATLQLVVIDYNSGSPIQSVINLEANESKADNYSDQCQGPIHITAGDYNHDGKDEIAIALRKTLYIYSVNKTSKLNGLYYSLSANLLSKTDLSSYYTSGSYVNTTLPRIDIESADSDGDGYKELLVTVGAQAFFAKPARPSLLIYHNTTDLSKPTAKILLSDSIGYSFYCASVAVGDLFGTGQKEIVIAGVMDDPNNNDQLTTVKYDPVKGTYDKFLKNRFYDLGVNGDTKTHANHVLSDLEYLNCVSLKAPTPGQLQDVVYGDDIYEFNTAANNAYGGFVKQNVSNSVGGYGDISGVSYKHKDYTYIIKTLVGNFDGNKKGQQQIIMLHYNTWANGDHGALITMCYEATNGTIYRSDHGANINNYPSICAPDVFINGERLVYDKAEFTFSDPTIIAVLGATPYYKEIPNDSYQALGNCGTTYGTENGTEHESENGFSVKVGQTWGFESEQQALVITVTKESLDFSIESSFSNKWSNSKSFSTSVGYTGYYNQDTAVVSVIPYDIYYYKLYDSKNPNGIETSIKVPYAPETTTLSVDYYNSVAKNIANAPIISSDVLKHTVGDPRTYPSSTNGLSNIPKDNILTGGDGKGNQFVSSGMGNSSTEESITTGTSSGVAKEWSVETDVSASFTAFGIKSGRDYGAGYEGSETITSTSSTTRSGSVAAVPSGYSNYQFLWNLVAYDYDIGTNGHHQEFPVISYLVKPIDTIPPAQPDNLVVKTNGLGSALLSWNEITPSPVSPVTGYVISRSDDGGTNYTNIGTIDTAMSTKMSSYTDSGLQDGKVYYYKVAAYNLNPSTTAGIPTDSVSLTALSVNNISIAKQPDKLVYNNGDKLDLSGLEATMNFSDGTSMKAEASDFAQSKLSVSLGSLPVDLLNVPMSFKTDFILSAAETGTPITVTYTPTGLTATTNTLTVKANASTALAVQLQFNVGGQNNAAKLLPNQQLYVTANITNNQNIPQNLILMVVLYDANGNMANFSIKPGCIQALNAVQIDTSNNKFMLPANVSGYTAKAFIWDGTDITSSSLIPLCYPVQITG